jgi:ABC-type nickel/cobalt efflux system permease component RcnA
MTSFATLLQQGNSWLFVPSAVLLGALHGLEPGHSKTMMAAFIVAIRGTLAQAVLLGLSATVSHTAVVWVVALAGLYFGRSWNTAATEPYLQVASAVLIIAVAAWMLWRTRQIGRERDGHHAHDHDHHHDRDHDHDHDHDQDHGHAHQHGHTNIRAHAHDHERGRSHPAIGGYQVFELVAPGYQDPHELAHANDIRRRFAHREVTTAQIVVFGLTGGLIPCPASITVLLLCLQLKKLALGATLVLSFSVGLALTMVAVGAVAALGVRHAARRFSGFGELARRAPYFSGALILLVGLYIGYQGLHALA